MDSIKSLIRQIDNKYHKLWSIRIVGMIYGFTIGDAIGLQCERMTKSTIKELYPQGIKGFNKKGDYMKNGILNGDWTDETDQLLIMLELMVSTGWKFNRHLYASHLKKWKENGFQEFGDIVGLGYSSYMGAIINDAEFCADPHGVAERIYNEMKFPTNDAMPRIPVLSIMDNWEDCIIDATAITNPDTRCIVSTLFYGFILNKTLSKGFDIVKVDEDYLLAEFNKLKDKYISEQQLIEFNRYGKIYFGDIEKLLGGLEIDADDRQQFTLTSLGIAIYAYRNTREMIMIGEELADIYEITILDIINRGGDSDNNASVAGSIIGAILGYKFIPEKWINKLLYRNRLAAKIISFLS